MTHESVGNLKRQATLRSHLGFNQEKNLNEKRRAADWLVDKSNVYFEEMQNS